MEKTILIKKLPDIPRRAGIYKYSDKLGHVLYVGKALSLRGRISSYAQKDITGKTQEMLSHAHQISWIETGSDFEAPLLEAKLIKLHKPKYNVTFRDDKSYLYIFISTGEEYPKVFLTRKPKNEPLGSGKKYEQYESLKGEYFGPFPSAATARSVLKWLRRAFPFCTQKKLGKRACFYSHIGLCHPCPSYIVQQEESTKTELKKTYRKSVFYLRTILKGNFTSIRKTLLSDMQHLAQEQRFEEAQKCKIMLERFEWILRRPPSTDVFLENPNFYAELQRTAADSLREILFNHNLIIAPLTRIECFDISTIQGNLSVASQVTFIHGIPEKGEYRHYRIRNDGIPNDFAMLAEAVKRRLKHKEWNYPDLLVIDGGKGQVSSIVEVLKNEGIIIPVIGLAKQFEKIVIPQNVGYTQVTLPKKSPALQLLQQLRDEAHRFAITYHRKRRNTQLLTTDSRK